tara:strand:+ start:1340 stop:1927 length:588 start_codon:yes stop_codon:yes gene_type:complete
MDSLLVFYFFILLIFLKSINIDYRLIIFVIILAIFYNYHYSKKENINDKLNNSLEKSNVYSFGNVINTFDDLDEKNIREIRGIKDQIYSMNIHKNDKIEIYSIIKKYFHIYNNYSKYSYKHNWINDLHEFENSIYNKISSLNISYENMEDEIQDLFNEAQDIINSLKSNFSNHHVYNNIDHPSGYDKNIQKSYMF